MFTHKKHIVLNGNWWHSDLHFLMRSGTQIKQHISWCRANLRTNGGYWVSQAETPTDQGRMACSWLMFYKHHSGADLL